MKEDAEKPAPKETPEAAAKQGEAMKWIVLAVVSLLVVGGGAGGFFWWRGRAAASTEGRDSHQKAAHAETGLGVLTFEPFVVNLADAEGARFLRVNLRLLVDSAEHASEIQEDQVKMLRIRSVILETLSVQLADTLVTPEGKQALKKTLAEKATAILGGMKVTDVLFSEFVVQF